MPPGTSAVGPGEYGCGIAACEPQVESTKPSCGLVKIGRGYRKGNKDKVYDFSEPRPGPGSYTLPGGLATRAKGSPYRDSPAAFLSGRTKFGSPW